MNPAPRHTIHLSLRTDVRNADHHLWNNHGTFWCHFTLHCPAGTKQRVRRSLRTGDVALARRRRDALLARLGRGGSHRAAAPKLAIISLKREGFIPITLEQLGLSEAEMTILAEGARFLYSADHQ